MMIEKKTNTPTYFPSTIAVFVTGAVIKNSIVPVSFSSEKSLMVISGTKKTNINSIRRKTSLSDASRF